MLFLGRWIAHGAVAIACYRLLSVPPPTLRWWALLVGLLALSWVVRTTMRNVASGSESDHMTPAEADQWVSTVAKFYMGILVLEIAAALYVALIVAHGDPPMLETATSQTPGSGIGISPRSFKCQEPIPEFTLGQDSDPSPEQIAKLCACIWSKLPEGGWERELSAKLTRGEDPGWRLQGFVPRFNAAVEACGGRSL